MKSFEEFKETLLESFDIELNEYKEKFENIQDVIMKSNIKIQEIDKKILELSKSKDSSFDIFSPSEHGEDFNSLEIGKLNKTMEVLKEELETDKKIEMELKSKISNKEKIVKMVDTYKVPKEEISNIGEIKKCKEKLEFCSKICITDSNRCKIELEKIINDLSNIIDDNVSRETLN
ncbi:MAG: hypothetical protein HDT39_14335 [Lachnospiraceae bacterium]|nr:hypothetical protein [Lachnospiraceae bacterium]